MEFIVFFRFEFCIVSNLFVPVFVVKFISPETARMFSADDREWKPYQLI